MGLSGLSRVRFWGGVLRTVHVQYVHEDDKGFIVCKGAEHQCILREGNCEKTSAFLESQHRWKWTCSRKVFGFTLCFVDLSELST